MFSVSVQPGKKPAKHVPPLEIVEVASLEMMLA